MFERRKKILSAYGLTAKTAHEARRGPLAAALPGRFGAFRDTLNFAFRHDGAAGGGPLARVGATGMKCSYSGRPAPKEKLFILYYPPAAAHENWDKSVFAAARAREALRAAVAALESFYWRHVVSKKFYPGLLAALAGAALLGFWAFRLFAGGGGDGVLFRYLPPFAGLILLGFGRFRLRAFLRRASAWKERGKTTVEAELAAVKARLAELPDDPDAEEAADVMRRECPAVLSEIAFQGVNYRAFTYLDFVLFPQLKHPARKEDLPGGHSLYRDAYYIGDVVYDGWRVFQKGRRGVADPRFVGSGGRRGVI